MKQEYIEVEPLVNTDKESTSKNAPIEVDVVEEQSAPAEDEAVKSQAIKVAPTYVNATFVEDEKPPKRPSLIGSLGKKLIGTFLVLIGIPLLIFPGPGIAVIGVGLLLILDTPRNRSKKEN